MSPEQVLPIDGVAYSELGVEQLLLCSLSDIPLQINLLEKSYKLRGCASFVPPQSSHGMGHYTAFCRRLDGTWENYDDLKDKEVCVKSLTNVYIHLVVYSV